MIAILLALLPPADLHAEPVLVDRVSEIEFNGFPGGNQILFFNQAGWIQHNTRRHNLADLQRRKRSITFRDGASVRTVYADRIDTLTPGRDPQIEEVTRFYETQDRLKSKGYPPLPYQRVGLKRPEKDVEPWPFDLPGDE